VTQTLCGGASIKAAALPRSRISSTIQSPHLDFQLLNNQLVLSWTNAGFNLQSAPVVTGPFTNLPGATSPYTNALTGPQQFFRLISN
jgi:hypothetical protein